MLDSEMTAFALYLSILKKTCEEERARAYSTCICTQGTQNTHLHCPPQGCTPMGKASILGSAQPPP